MGEPEMVSLIALWIPIVVSAVFVFLASWVLHMLLTYHRSEYRMLPGEEKIMELMRKAGVKPGGYAMPCPGSPKEMGSPEMIEKYKAGPVAYLTVIPDGPPGMGKGLAQWFGFCLLVGIFCAYITSLTLDPGTHYRMVFRITGTVAFMGYAMGELIDSIWKGRNWSATFKHVFDGLVYSLLTAGTFGWLWPE